MRKRWFVRIEFKPEDLWVGLFWRHGNTHRKPTFDAWLCLLPCVPIHFGWRMVRQPAPVGPE